MFCSQCQNEMPDGSAFCNNCGARLMGGGAAAGPEAQTTAQYPQPQTQPNPQAKSKIAAGVLGILLGCFGVHNFYLGFTGKAVCQLLLGTVGIFIFVGPIISSIWGLVEGIMILCSSNGKDARGVPLQN